MRINIQTFQFKTNKVNTVYVFCIHKITRNFLWKCIQYILWVIDVHLGVAFSSLPVSILKLQPKTDHLAWQIKRNKLVRVDPKVLKLFNNKKSACIERLKNGVLLTVNFRLLVHDLIYIVFKEKVFSFSHCFLCYFHRIVMHFVIKSLIIYSF